MGVITAITLQLQRITSAYVTTRRRRAASFAERFTLFAVEEAHSDFMEAWVDGFASGQEAGRGVLTSAALSDSADSIPFPHSIRARTGLLETSLIHLAASLTRPALLPEVRMANRARTRWSRPTTGRRGLYPFTFWPPAAFAGYQALFPQGVETFQTFVPRQFAQETFKQIVCYSQEQGCLPIWCVIKQHRLDPFLLSYQVDRFSLE